MRIIVICEYADGSEQAIGDFLTVEEAIVFALDQANNMGSATGDSHGLPAFVHVLNDEKRELTIKVFRGGLTPSRAH